MVRVHLLTHPHLGPASWKEMEAHVLDFRRRTGVRICAWCHEPVPAGRRTRCGGDACTEMLWQAQRWNRCAQVCLRRNRICPCGERAAEVDHKVPVSLGGTGDQGNLRGLCRACHKIETARLRKLKSKYRFAPVPSKVSKNGRA